MMIRYLNGILTQKAMHPAHGAYLEIDVNGVGYGVLTSTQSLASAPPLNSPALLYTSLIVREDAQILVGFMSKDEREMFELVSSASGVGTKVALSLLSGLSVPELATAILSGEYKPLTAAKGVGPKLAQKMVLELKDKLTKRREGAFESVAVSATGSIASQWVTPAAREVEEVLVSLGYTPEEIAHVQRHISQDNLTNAEAMLQASLKWLSTQTVS